jgi:hypothetical protein
MDSPQIIWQPDPKTREAADKFRMKHISAKEPQFQGFRFHVKSWRDKTLEPRQWPEVQPIYSSPDNIIALFQQGAFLEALAMVVSWGKMWRRPDNIYGHRPWPLTEIKQMLEDCSASIQKMRSIENAWGLLTGNPGWSAVIASKTLHFLSRACGFHQQPPVAIDNMVILECLWPDFVKDIPAHDRPDDWRGNTFAAYSRYMTAILVWAGRKQWTTTEVEATIFKKYYPTAGV